MLNDCGCIQIVVSITAISKSNKMQNPILLAKCRYSKRIHILYRLMWYTYLRFQWCIAETFFLTSQSYFCIDSNFQLLFFNVTIIIRWLKRMNIAVTKDIMMNISRPEGGNMSEWYYFRSIRSCFVEINYVLGCII